ncbi:MAG: hypothetical protein KDE27_08320, partial [Planctomycetes bacterium]|nr:hypothetical protein [Planctomycetota bacterium]
PPPPRRLTADDLRAAAAAPECAFVARKRGRTALPNAALRELGYRPFALPAALAAHPHGDEIELWRR